MVIPTRAAVAHSGTAATVFATWDPANKGPGIVLSSGNRVITQPTYSSWNSVRATIGKTAGKWYWEITLSETGPGAAWDSGVAMLGICNSTLPMTTFLWGAAKGGGAQPGTAFTGTVNGITGDSAVVPTTINGDVWGFALDLGAGKLWMRKGTTWYDAAPPGSDTFSAITADTWYPAVSRAEPDSSTGGTSFIITANFGASAFAQPVPAGFNAGVF